MKKQPPRKKKPLPTTDASCSEESAPPLFPDPASSPGGGTPPPPAGGGPLLDFSFYGTEDSVKGFADGRFVQHAMPLEGATRTFVFSLRGGPYQRRTLSQLEAKALLGPCTIAIVQGETRILADGQSMTIPMGSTFTLQASNKAVLFVTSLADPGLGDYDRGGSELD